MHASLLPLSASLSPKQHCPSQSKTSQENECQTTASAESSVMKPVHPGGTATLHCTANDDSRTTTASAASSQRQQPPMPATSSKCVGAASPFVVNGNSVGLRSALCGAAENEPHSLSLIFHPFSIPDGRIRDNVDAATSMTTTVILARRRRRLLLQPRRSKRECTRGVRSGPPPPPLMRTSL